MEGTRTAHRLRAAALAAVVTAAAGARAADRLVVPLHPLPALSSVRSAAKGSAVVDRAAGLVEVEAQALPPLPRGGIYKLFLVDNTPGPGHSVALDVGDDVDPGDEILDVGPLELQGGAGRLSTRLDSSRLSSFGLDMVAVVREMPGTPAELIIGGLVSVRDKGAGDPSLDTLLEGARLFSRETFEGNGRACATCHPPANNFTLSPAFIAALPGDDPLFVAERVPALAGLENPALMRSPRALILENIDGFERPPVFRGTPHILNAALTGPYGMSGDVPTLGEFALAAIVQHAPRRLERIPGIDFRLPDQEELDALEAFQLSVLAPPDLGFDVSAVPTTDQERRGRDLFFGAAKCMLCHAGPALSEPDAKLGGKRTFNTGVAKLVGNRTLPPECPSCGPLGEREANGEREFNVPPLVGAARTAPFFHDNSAPTLRDAVRFYDSAEFNSSPAARLVGGIQLRRDQIDDLTAFLAALTSCGNGMVDHGEACDDGNLESGDSCRGDCSVEICGDGILDPGEACDDGAANGHDDCCSANCQLLDGDGDGTCDRDECPNLSMVASVMSRVRKVILDYAATGPGGGDDALRVIGAVFRTGQNFDPAVTDDVRVTVESVRTRTTLLSTTLPAGFWVRPKAPRKHWMFRDGTRRAKLREGRPGVYRFRMSVVGTNLVVTEPLNQVGSGVRLVVEIGEAVCAEGRLLACASRTPAVDRCRE